MRSALILSVLGTLHAQNWQATPAFPIAKSPIAITRPAQSRMPFTVAGEMGAIFGQQDGSFEAWAYPIKIASHFRITAELADYPIPIDLSDYAAQIEVNPDHTTIIYSHAAFTVKQHVFSARGEGATGPVVFYEIASTRPLTLTFRFTQDMLRMWPAPNFGLPSAEWVQPGFYVLHTDNDAVSGAIGIPGATPGVLAPYQERPRTWPVELKLTFDPKTQSRMFFPLLMTAGGKPADVAARLVALNKSWTKQYARTADYYAHFFDHRLWTETPDPQFDLAIKWAEISIDQAQVRFHDETGLIAGYYSSADSARPGFAWFFGRDTLFSLYAANSYGDFALSRRALEFLLKRQRADGKIMHEYSQTADLVDWSATPYFYASADSTPLLIMTVADYVGKSGDKEFLRAHWEQIKKAWAFIRAHDSDGDGIYENTEGTGWVESWPGGMPHQEIYLAALDQQSATAMELLAGIMGDAAIGVRSHEIANKLAQEYPVGDFYAFSRNPDGSLDRTATAFPSVAWWDGTLALPRSEKMFERWASHEFSTDWGVRDVSRDEKIYDPMSYHQGSVWPLYTGWMALAEYRAHRPFAGYAHLMQNARMTFTQDLGAVTELLSGEFFQPFGRSSSHQLWSSAMVLTPAIRGLFGMGIEPQLPASWESATLHNMPMAGRFSDVHFKKDGAKLIVESSGAPRVELPLPPFEVNVPAALPAPGAPTSFPKILTQSENSFDIEGIGGTTAELDVRFIKAPIQINGATLAGRKLMVHFPPGEGYRRTSVKFTW